MNKSKNKGNRFEREVVNEAKNFGIRAYRNFCSRSPLSDKADIVIDEYEIQCKKKARGFKKLYNEIEEVDGLILGSDFKKPLVVIRFKDWLNLILNKKKGCEKSVD